MFYPADSLRRGGRFYLLWVADSWPHRFASISHRQLWSQDVRQLCDQLKEVMISESGRPTRRYSLRLSSQLMRGLVRVYERQVSVLRNDLCMIQANVIKNSNKRHNIQEVTEQAGDKPQGQVSEHRRRTVLLVEESENEQRIEEILQNSGNVVASIQEITLKEAAITDPLPPPNEGFGEESAQQALQFLSSRRSVEQMMVPSESAAHSALDLPALDTDKSHDKTRLAPHHVTMERISGQDLTLLRPSDGGLLSTTDLGKEIPDIPDFPILPIPELPDPHEKPLQVMDKPDVPIEQQREIIPRVREIEAGRESTQIELEELEEIEPRAKRRRKLIIDRKTQISSDVLRARIQNPRIELWCQNSSDVIIDMQVPYELYMHRPCHAGCKERSNIAPALTRLYMRNLGIINRNIVRRELEEGEMQRLKVYRTRSRLEHIPELAELTGQPEAHIQKRQEIIAVDIADMATQKLENLSQEKDRGKRGSDGTTPSPKRQRSDYGVGCVSLENQKRLRKSEAAMAITEAGKMPEIEIEVDKENIAANEQTPARVSKGADEDSIPAMLLKVGLSDLAPQAEVIEVLASQTRQSRRQGDESSESLLGSLDRTKVSLGESDTTTDSKRFIRDEWGAVGTMYKISKCINARNRGETITVESLIAKGPIIHECKNIITAKCFTSVLRLKQYGYITIKKCPNTLEILDIMLGPKFKDIYTNTMLV